MGAQNVEIVRRAVIPTGAGLADDWWYWAARGRRSCSAAAVFSGRYRAVAARARAAALRRGLVELPPGRTLDRRPRGFWSDLSLARAIGGHLGDPLPGARGYHDVSGAITTDVVTGAVVALSLAARLSGPVGGQPAGRAVARDGSLDRGLRDATRGPVGLSDTIAGIVVCAVALAGLSAARRFRGGRGRRSGIPPGPLPTPPYRTQGPVSAGPPGLAQVPGHDRGW